MSEFNINDSEKQAQAAEEQPEASNISSQEVPSDPVPTAFMPADQPDAQISEAAQPAGPAVADAAPAEAPYANAAPADTPRPMDGFAANPQPVPGQIPQAPERNDGFAAQYTPPADGFGQSAAYYSPSDAQGAQNGQPQMNAPRQNPYGAPSQGYFRPQTNEFVYSPDVPRKKLSFGKGLIIAIACVLAVFIVSIVSISAYGYFTGAYTLRSPYTDSQGNSLDPDKRQSVDLDKHAFRNDTDSDEDIEDDDYDDDDDDFDDDDFDDDDYEGRDDDEVQVISPEPIRDAPAIQQADSQSGEMSLPDIYDKVIKSVVGVSTTVRNGTQTGTGFIISEDGYIVTNAHVIEDYSSVMIVDENSKEYEAQVIGSDEQTDIAVLKIDPSGSDLQPVEFGKSGDLRIGDQAIAIGNPLGFELYGTMTTGIISGLNRTVTVGDNTMNLLQTSASINSGNSGGPLINSAGMVVGITSAKVNSIYGESLGFAIPIDEALPIIENLIEYGYVPGRPSLGLNTETITDIMSLYYRIPKGVYVRFVTPGSGAERAGVLAGDIIIGIEGETVEDPDELNEIKNRYAVGDTVTLTVYRGGQNFDIDVVLTESTPN